ncbi:PP2C family protein-serine/threonine phosphatase [Streptomyces uncialis]|uniref:PP2C family protein-serine/threonine phosphatase n=1 Tax=Streptomyces uncialis TaxID=1048205 RepID=UPI00365E49FC
MDLAQTRPTVPLFVSVLPAVMIVAGTVYDIMMPTEYTAVPMLSAAPLIAAPFFSWLPTLLISLVSVVVLAGLHAYEHSLAAPQSYTEQVTLITVAALALLINQVVRRGGERLASARVVAEAAQRAVLPTPPARVGALSVAVRYEAALADAFIGGDLFAVQDTARGVRLIVGDVQGKGLDAVAEVAVAIGAFREAADQETSLRALAGRLDGAMSREATRRGTAEAAESFTTAVLGEIPPGTATVRLVNRGHPAPLILGPGGEVTRLPPAAPALPLGMAGLGSWPDRTDEHPLPDGSMLLFHTDGLDEARDTHGVFYDPPARLRGRSFPGPEQLLDFLITDVRRHTGGRATDDLALLALFAGPPPPPG